MDRQFEITVTFPLPGDNELDHAKILATIAPAIDAVTTAASAANIAAVVTTRSFTPKAARKVKEKAPKPAKAA